MERLEWARRRAGAAAADPAEDDDPRRADRAPLVAARRRRLRHRRYEARLRGSIDFASKVKFSTEEVESLPNGLQQYPRYGADGVRGTGTFVYELRARARADEGAAIYSEWSAPSADSTSMEIVDAPTVRLLPRIADGAAAVEVSWVPPGGKPDADDADALHWRYQLDCMMEAVDTAGATPGGRAASWFPVAWTASEAHAVPVRLTADYGRTVRFRVRVLPGGHYGDNTWEERGVLTGYDDDGGSPGGDPLGKPKRQLDLDEIRAESRRLVAGLKSVYDGKSAETFSPPSRTLALPVLIEPELLSAGARAAADRRAGSDAPAARRYRRLLPVRSGPSLGARGETRASGASTIARCPPPRWQPFAAAARRFARVDHRR